MSLEEQLGQVMDTVGLEFMGVKMESRGLAYLGADFGMPLCQRLWS